ncbi:DUF4374 domain-containing protein [Fulvivirga maritima]|uniref:DUF4374 domain-containing protein n=1 Tax=Fulvivirga maritima TaxID=2904247 RepID=UPI001F2DF0BA|nr:DUF4374 domain-containing protein [Fulvivirga maritima]UII28384.1 DUF4374 domain-containing protein [Fulvivirga maritima]
MRRMKQFAFSLLAASAAFLMTACSDDDDDNTPSGPAGDYVLSLAIQGSEGGFTYYSVPFQDVMSGNLSATGRGIEQPGYYDFTQIDETIYSIGGLDDVNVVGISRDANNELIQVGDVSFPASLSDIVKADDNTLISVTVDNEADSIIFNKFNPNTVAVTETKSVAVSAITNEVGPSYSGMVVSGDHLFLSYYISMPESPYSTLFTDEAQVAVFSYPELELEKIITDDRVGPIGGFNTKSGLVKDEDGNIYAFSHSNPANGYTQSTKPSGVLKINSGETEFDTEYFFDIAAASDGYNTAHVKYLEDGRAFAEINVADRSEQVQWADGPLQSAIIDFENQTVNFIADVPEHPGQGRRLAALYADGYVYICIPQGDDITIYRMDPDTYTSTVGATVEANFVAGFFKQ